MMLRIARLCLASILAVALFFPLNQAFSCGPYFPETIFVQSQHPDLPFDRFAAGQLGVIHSTYSRSFLVVAYRYLSGGSFSTQEQQQLLALWAHNYGREEAWLAEKQDAYIAWRVAEAQVSGGPMPSLVQENDRGYPGYRAASSQYYDYENCAEDAFRTAVQTLNARGREFGYHSPAVQSWRAAQNAVFDDCDASSSDPLELPEDAPKELPAVIRADRAYQIAAAYFYGRDWDEAQKRFEAIAGDASSPWRGIAGIVAQRARLRRITLSDKPIDDFIDDLAAIDAQLRHLELLPYMRELLPAIWRMRGFVEFRLDPDARRVELARVLANDEHPATLYEDLGDYTKLINNAVADELDAQPIAPAPQPTHGPFSNDPMADWIFSMQATDQASANHALGSWRQSHSQPWLIAALARTTPASPSISELLQAAAAVPPDSPGYLTVAFHRARLLLQSGNPQAARAIAESVSRLPSIASQVSARNLFFAIRLKLAGTLDEFLRFAPRNNGVVTYNLDGTDLPDEDAKPLGSRFDFDAAALLTEKIPTRILAEAASSSQLPKDLRRRVAQSAWVRSVLLNDQSTALQLAPVLSTLAPDLADGLKSFVVASGSSRRFAAALLILHDPGLHPYIASGVGRETPPGKLDEFRDNWWCSLAPYAKNENWNSYGNNYYTYTTGSGPVLSLYPEGKLSNPRFLSAAEAKSAAVEWESLKKQGSAPTWLAAQVLAFAKFAPDDLRVPKGLHLAVRATHLGCSDGETSRYSRAAFRMLHQRYSGNPWTAKTPFWY